MPSDSGKPLQRDVADVIVALGRPGELFLLRGRMATKTGNDLADEAYVQQRRLHDELYQARERVRVLEAEVNGPARRERAADGAGRADAGGE